MLVFHVNVADRGIVQHWNQEPVLVSSVELVNGPNGKIPSIVGLYLAHDKTEEIWGGDVCFNPLHGIFKSIGCGVDGKLGSFPISSRNQPTDRLEPHVIQGALEIMDDVSEYYGQIVAGASVLDICKVAINEFASTISVYLGRDSQSFFQAIDSKFKVRNVMVGPFDFETGTFAGGHTA